MAHWYVVGVLVLGAASGLAYYVWDLTRSYLDLQDKCFSQGREITRLCGERFDLQGKLMQAEASLAEALQQRNALKEERDRLAASLEQARDGYENSIRGRDANIARIVKENIEKTDQIAKLKERLKIDEQNTEQWINAANVASDRVAELVETIAQHERILAAARDDISKVHHALGGSPVLRPRAEESEA